MLIILPTLMHEELKLLTIHATICAKILVAKLSMRYFSSGVSLKVAVVLGVEVASDIL